MPTIVTLTPHYFLLDNNKKIGPETAQHHSERSFRTLYGFSSKPQYDLFIANAATSLQPYPLVSRYLESCLQNQDFEEQLIAIDASGPKDAEVPASTMKNVLAAIQNKKDTVEVCYQLKRREDSILYEICKSSTIAGSEPTIN